MPLADNSAMDGFVIREWDTSAASAAKPVLLRIVGTLKAGDGRRLRLAPGKKKMTQIYKRLRQNFFNYIF
jgi:molybdopterin biosynthesis enzyme